MWLFETSKNVSTLVEQRTGGLKTKAEVFDTALKESLSRCLQEIVCDHRELNFCFIIVSKLYQQSMGLITKAV